MLMQDIPDVAQGRTNSLYFEVIICYRKWFQIEQ